MKSRLRFAIPACFIAGLSCAAMADEPAYSEALATVIEVTETQSEPFYNGSYFTTVLSAPEHCQLDKIVTYLSADDEIEKVSTTRFDLAQIDPARIEADHFGGVKFWSLGEAAIFPMQHSQGSDFSAMLPGDNLTVRDEASEAPILVGALTALVAQCAG